jgi:hypothetical protein
MSQSLLFYERQVSMKSVQLSKDKARKVSKAMLKREDVLRAQVRSVAQSYTNALFLYGPGGLGKSHIVASELESLVGKSWRHHTAYTTAKGLLLGLAEYPDQVHVFEDCEAMYKNAVCSSILRAACGAPKQKDRWVIYETAHECLRVNFKGGIVIVSNENLARGSGPLSAVASRFRPIMWDLTVLEKIVRIREMALDGWRKGDRSLTADECSEVAEFLIDEMQSGVVQVPVDLRTFCDHALPAFALCKVKGSHVSWKDMVASKLQGHVGVVEKRDEKNVRLQQVAMTIYSSPKLDGKQKLDSWTKATGLGRAIYFRHLRLAKASQPAGSVQ